MVQRVANEHIGCGAREQCEHAVRRGYARVALDDFK
jgi:hypothetical protein